MSRGSEIAVKSALLLTAVVTWVIALEIGLRWLYPVSVMSMEVRGTGSSADALFVPDRTLGFRPVLGTSLYDANGIVVTRSVISHSDDPRRILFLGDSVTARAAPLMALAAQLGSDTTSYLNGGVEAYNIQQEIEFFFRYQVQTKPQMIIHEWHLYNLRPSRLMLRTNDGGVRIYSQKARPEDVIQWLYDRSQLYRLWIANFRSKFSPQEVRSGAADALSRMHAYARDHGIVYQAVLFPYLVPFSRWSDDDRDGRTYLLSLARELDIPILDLLPISEGLIERGINPREHADDTAHPNKAFADAAAEYMIANIPSLRAGK